MRRSNKNKNAAVPGLEGVAADKRSVRMLRASVVAFKAALFLVPAIIGAIISGANASWIPFLISLAIGVLAFCSVHVVMEWEAAVVLRLGRLHRVAKPGILFTIPLVDFIAAYVDQRLNATTFQAERTLTADCVPVNVDAVLFWMVWDPQSACLEVNNYRDAVYWAAQTTLRDAIGSVSISELSTRRKSIDEEIKDVLVRKTESWGITVSSVEMRDVVVPEELQDALSKEAQAEFERNARVTLAEVEEDISEMFVRAASNYDENERAMQLRGMSMIYDGVKQQGGLVLLPNDLVSMFGDKTAKQ